MLKLSLLALLVVVTLATENGIVSIFVNNGELPSAITMGQGSKRARFSANGDTIALETANGTVFSISPAAPTQGAYTDDLVGSVEMSGSLSVGDIFSDDYEILSTENRLQNWLIAGGGDDLFTNDTLGWSTSSGAPLSVQKCGGISILGGHNVLNTDSITKTYALPKHAEIQVTARFSFIDDWDDDWAFMKLDGNTMWTEQYVWCPEAFTFICKEGHNACGNPKFPDRLSRLITVSMPHTAPSLTIEFGSMIHEAVPSSIVSYGVSSVTIEVR